MFWNNPSQELYLSPSSSRPTSVCPSFRYSKPFCHFRLISKPGDIKSRESCLSTLARSVILAEGCASCPVIDDSFSRESIERKHLICTFLERTPSLGCHGDGGDPELSSFKMEKQGMI